jgi:alpha-galactosidase
MTEQKNRSQGEWERMQTAAIIVKTWGRVGLSCRLQDNSYDVNCDGLQLEDCYAAVRLDGKLYRDFSWQLEDNTDSCLTLSSDTPFGECRLRISQAQGKMGLSLDLSVQLTRGLRSLELLPLCLTTLKADHLFIHGRKMGGCANIVFPNPEPREFESHFQHLITCEGRTLQLSHPLRQDHISTIVGTAGENELRDLAVCTRIEFPEPGEHHAETLSLAVDTDGFQLLENWTEVNRNPDKRFAESAAGWNSWDYYRWTITEDEVLENAEFIASDPVLSQHVKRLIVDDGWQYCYGEWDANPLFPNGMEYLAQKLKRLGLEPGLWFAPTVIEPHCRIAQWHSDMLAMGESGQPCLAYECMRRVGFLLDPTRDKVQQWLADLFDRYVRMGYQYFKLDFLAQTFKAPRFHRNIPRGRLMEAIVAPIHKAVAGRARILGCNYTFDGGTDVVDAVRIGSDIHSTWDHVQANAFSVANRFWSHDKLWINDPDFAVCRGPDTADDPDLGRLKSGHVFVTPDSPYDTNLERSYDDITLAEAQVLLSLVVISGGAVNLSDKLTRLNDQGLDLLRRTVAARSLAAGIPLDLFSSIRPSYWLQDIKDGKRALLINWQDRESELRLDLNAHGINAAGARDFWSDKPVGLTNGQLQRVLPPHSCLMVEIRR